MKTYILLLLLVSSICTQTALEVENNKFDFSKYVSDVFTSVQGQKETKETNVSTLVWVLEALASEIVDKIVDLVFDAAQDRIYNGNFVRMDVSGGIFFSDIKDGWVCAAFYHPDSPHTATADGGILGGGVIRSTAGPGQWAVACSRAGIGGRKTYYNVL